MPVARTSMSLRVLHRGWIIRPGKRPAIDPRPIGTGAPSKYEVLAFGALHRRPDSGSQIRSDRQVTSSRTMRAGLPAATQWDGTIPVTTAYAPMIALSPTVEPLRSVA